MVPGISNSSYARAVTAVANLVKDNKNIEIIAKRMGGAFESIVESSKPVSKIILDIVSTAAVSGNLDLLVKVVQELTKPERSGFWTPDQVRTTLESPPEAEPSTQSQAVLELTTGFRSAAAVLLEFDPSTIKPLILSSSANDRPRALANLLADSERLTFSRDGGSNDLKEAGAAGAAWSLRAPVRRQVLRDLISRDLLKPALGANPDRPDTVSQRFFEAALQRRLPPLSEVPDSDRPALLWVVNLLEDVVSGLPSAVEVRSRIELGSLLAPFEQLAGKHFCGRASELNLLKNYVGIARNRSYSSKLVEGVRSALGLYEKPPLLITGIGGLGKSTLLARFILEHSDEIEAGRKVSFVYLDLDRPGLCAEEPTSLLVESARQLALQYPAIAGLADGRIQKWVRDIYTTGESHADSEATRRIVNISSSSSSPENEFNSPSAAAINQQQFIDQFAELVESADAMDRPLIFVLDTFEEVQVRSADFVDSLFEFLDSMQRRLPRLRTILAGRNEVPNFRTQLLALGNLARADARQYLRSRGVDDSVAATISAALPGNPLLLRVIAEWYLKLGEKERKSLNFSDLTSLDAELAQAVVYRRFLDHVTDAQVRRVASPGLVLRVITPDLIRYVLAQPCNLGEISEPQAQQLFEELKLQMPVINDEAGVLRLRSDLRRTMVRAIEREQPSQAIDIHTRAIAYYQSRDVIPDRAEELYHRLKLDQDHKILDARWLDGVIPLLQNTVDELPANAKSYLSSRVGRYSPDVDWDRADQADWERYVRGRANDLLRLNRPGEAVALLSRRPFSVASRLGIVLSRALIRTGDIEGARRTLQDNIAETQKVFPADSESRSLLLGSLLYEWSIIEEYAGSPERAITLLMDARGHGQRLGANRFILEICCRGVRLARQLNDKRMARTFVTEIIRIILAHPPISRVERLAAAEVYAFEPDFTIQSLQRMGLADPGDVSKRDIVWLLSRWDALPEAESGRPLGELGRLAGVDLSRPGDQHAWSQFAAPLMAVALLKIADSYLINVRPGRMLELAVEFVRRSCDSASPLVANEQGSALS